MAKQPKKEDYGWQDQKFVDDPESGWMLEEGEQAYNEAMKQWIFDNNRNYQHEPKNS